MKAFRLLATIVLSVCAIARLQANTLDDANRAFAEGHFAEAAAGYEAIINEKGYSTPVLFDLANAYFREGQLGRAILNYERAQVIAPNDPDIAANLQFARKQAGLFVEQTSWIGDATRFFSMNVWAWLGSAALVVLCALIALSQLYPSQRLYLRIFSCLAALAICAAVAAIVLQFDTLDRGVVTSNEAVARISPFDAAKSAFVLSAGEVVELEKAHDGFVFVKSRNNRLGWVSKEQVEAVIPTAGGS